MKESKQINELSWREKVCVSLISKIGSTASYESSKTNNVQDGQFDVNGVLTKLREC